VKRFYIQRDKSIPPSDFDVFRVDDNLFTGEDDFAEAFTTPSSLELDLLLIASSIFAVDRAYSRGAREDICRSMELSIPIVNFARLYPLIPLIEETLYRLSNDAWTIIFRQEPGNPEGNNLMGEIRGRTLLFSGGLDSFAASIELGNEPESLQLVSHITRNRIIDESQKALCNILRHRGYTLPHHQCFISSRSGGPTNLAHDDENSQRTRSFVFLVLAALMARRSGHKEIIYIAENGQMAIHLPLTCGRIGAFSTHTAHPEVILSMEKFLNSALMNDFKIINPYVHRTKREVVQVVYNFAPEAIQLSNSCWRNTRLPEGTSHCGGCIPCLIRRIAIECITADNTRYKRNPFLEDVLSLSPEDEARRNLLDLAEFINKIEHNNDEEIVSEWPELYSEAIDSRAVIEMYRRFSFEARTIFNRYPKLQYLLQ
jgi:7-cyano-7-deazaguanine synthase in queuosine biosynthesis